MLSADMAPLPMDGGNSGAEVESGLEISLRPDNGGLQEANTKEQQRQEIIFVDEAVDDFQQLIVELESQREKGRRFDIVGLDSDRDGIAQISAYLSQQQNVDAVHIISHGTDGEVILGTSRLNSTTLDGYAEAIEGWQQALTGDADLLFYGCNLAAGDDGQDLVRPLTLLTGADVAASDDATGSTPIRRGLGVEYGHGDIETALAINPETQQNWNGVLAHLPWTPPPTRRTTTRATEPQRRCQQDLPARSHYGGQCPGVANEIILNAGTYTLSLGPSGDDAAATGISISQAISPSPAPVGCHDHRWRLAGSRTSYTLLANLTLTNVTIQGGDTTGNGGGFRVDRRSANAQRYKLPEHQAEKGGISITQTP